MIVRNQARQISRVRLTAMLAASLAAVLLSAACSSGSTSSPPKAAVTVTVTATPTPASQFSPSARSLAANPIGGVVTVTPSTSLGNVSTVTVSVGGFLPNIQVFVGECAHINGLFICDSNIRPSRNPGAWGPKFTTDSSGNGSIQFTVHRVFNGFVVAGQHYGQVDCTVSACYVGVGNHTQGAGSGQMSFKTGS